MIKIKSVISKLIFPVICVILVTGGVLIGMNWNNIFHGKDNADNGKGMETDAAAEDWDGEHDVYDGKIDEEQIRIPGFDMISFKAGEIEQKVNINNPEENNCYFMLTLSLPDGKVLWKSSLLEPGKGFYDIALNRKLEAGIYKDAHLRYDCYSYDDKQTPLNGADIKLTIKVID